MRGRSLLWAGPGVMLLDGRGPRAAPLAAEPGAAAAGAEPPELEIAAEDDRLAPVPAPYPAAGRVARDATYAGSSVTKTKG